MKILLMSDTHGDFIRIDSVLEVCGTIDQIIHCGDVERDCEYLRSVLPQTVPVLSVSGNNEWYAERPYHSVQSFGGIQFYITHGHLERVKAGGEALARKAQARGCSVALFGHTHRRTDEVYDGIRLINPGSVCYPGCSYALLTVAGGTLTVDFYELN